MKVKLMVIIGLSLIGFAFTEGTIVEFLYPSYFPTPVYSLTNNSLTKEKVALGRLLFYDPILSKDQTISCADCHSPYNAFAHTDHNLSHGINDSIGTRNAPALFNLAWQSSFMWDGAIHNLDMQALAPINHPAEMDEDIANVVKKLNQEPLYKKAFLKAWNDSSATGEYVLKSLAQFQLSLVSTTAPYDEMKQGTYTFNTQENSGYRLFQNNCNSCHTEPLFSNYGFANNGLPIDTSLNDLGKYAITNNDNDRLKFKVPSLRNLSYTYPYMHDGRFDKLHQVLNHYTHINLASDIPNEIVLTANEKADLIAFLLTLNDANFVFDRSNKYPQELLNHKKNQ